MTPDSPPSLPLISTIVSTTTSPPPLQICLRPPSYSGSYRYSSDAAYPKLEFDSNVAVLSTKKEGIDSSGKSPRLGSFGSAQSNPAKFTEEGDQRRALIKMHGLYCLSRLSAFLKSCLSLFLAHVPSFLVRISPATAKHKGQQANAPPFPIPSQYASPDLQATLSLPLMPTPMTTQSISGPLATSPAPASGSNNSLHTASGFISSVPSLSSNSSTTTLSNASDGLCSVHPQTGC